MKSNELFERIHNEEIEENTKIEVKTEEGKHIAYITYKDKKLNWNPGEFDTRYLCDTETEFKIAKRPWEIEKLDLKGRLTGDKITLIAQKVNELVDEINKRNEPLPF